MRQTTNKQWLADHKYCPSYDEGYQLVADHDERLGIGMIWPTRELVTTIAAAVRATGAKGVSSIGAGPGVLEWLLSEHFKPLAISAIDVGEELIGPAKWTVQAGSLKRGEIASVASSNALLFCYPTRAHYEKYVQQYQGSCIVIIADPTCDPYPGEGQAAVDFVAGFDMICCTAGGSSQFGLQGAALYIYIRHIA